MRLRNACYTVLVFCTSLISVPVLACEDYVHFTLKPYASGGASVWDCRTGQSVDYASADTALQAAIDAVEAGGSILLRAGSYQLRGGVELKDNIVLTGEVDASGAPSTVLTVANAATGGNTIRNFRPNLPKNDPNYLSGRQGIVIRNLIIDAASHVEYLISLNRCVDTTIKNVQVLNPRGSAFGSSGCVNLLFENCVARAPLSAQYGGHGFSIGGAPDAVRDVGTTLLNCSAYGFNWRSGVNNSEGVLLRGLAGTNCAPNCQGNLNFKVIGGNFADNAVGIRIIDANDPLIQNVNVYNNLDIGVEIYNTLLPKVATSASIIGGTFAWNGHAASDTSATSTMGGIKITGADSRVTGAYLVENRPNNLVLDGKYFYITASRLQGNGTRNHVFLIPYQGSPVTGWMVRSCYSGTAALWGGLPVSPPYSSVSQWITNWSPNPSDAPTVCAAP